MRRGRLSPVLMCAVRGKWKVKENQIYRKMDSVTKGHYGKLTRVAKQILKKIDKNRKLAMIDK